MSGVVGGGGGGHGEGTQVRSDDRRSDSQARSFIKVTEVTTRLVKIDSSGGGKVPSFTVCSSSTYLRNPPNNNPEGASESHLNSAANWFP